MWEAFLEIAGGFLAFAVSMFVADGIKYFLKPGQFIWKIFYKTNVFPFLWSLGAGILISSLIVFSPAHVIFIENITATDIEFDNMLAVWTSAVILGGIFKEKFGTSTQEVKTKFNIT